MRDVFKLTDSIGFHVGYVAASMKTHMTNEFKKRGYSISSAQWPIMVMLWQRDGRSQNELVNMIHKDKTSVARNITHLEKEDIIVRVQDRSDRRNNIIYLTNKGKQLENELVPLVKEFISKITRGVEKDDIEKVNFTLRQIYKNIQKEVASSTDENATNI